MLEEQNDADIELVPISRVPRPINLSEESSLVGDFLSVPLYVQSPVINREHRLAAGEDELVYSWLEKGVERTYVFTRPQFVPFPLPEHGELFFTLLAMFAARFNKEGKVYFRIVDIIKNAGKNPKSNSTYERVREMIWRYWQCTVTWDLGWKVKNFAYDEPQIDDPRSWRGNLIVEQSLFTAKASKINNRKYAEKTSNPNRLTNAYQWHLVVLNAKVVQAVEERFIRKFLTHTLQSHLSDKAKGVYRYFFKFSDRSAVERSYDTLMSAFAWFGRKSRFVSWLHSCLDELVTHGAVEAYREVIPGVAIAVKCAPVESLKSDICDGSRGTVDISSSSPAESTRQMPAKRGRRNLDCETFLQGMDGPTLARFANTLHSAAILNQVDFEQLNLIRDRLGERVMVENISNYLRRHWSKIGRQVKSLVKDAKTAATRDKRKNTALPPKHAKPVPVRKGATVILNSDDFKCTVSHLAADDLDGNRIGAGAAATVDPAAKPAKELIAQILQNLDPSFGSGQSDSAAEEMLDQMEAAIKQVRYSMDRKRQEPIQTKLL